MATRKKIRVGLIGLGYWGPNYARIFNELDQSVLIACCDLEEKNLKKIKKIYPRVEAVSNYKKLLDCRLDAVFITTPPKTHYQIAKFFLENMINVFLEKPFVSNYREGEVLKRIAKKNKLILMVGHVYEFNPTIIKVKEILDKKKLGEVYYVYAQRLGLGPIRKQANALWDLATHDISVALNLFEKFPQKVFALGGSYVQKNVEDMIFLSLTFGKNLIFNIQATWIAPEKIRKTVIVGSRGMLVIDDVNKSESLRFFDHKINRKMLNQSSTYCDHQRVISLGDVTIPQIDQTEPLKNQVLHFFDCLTNKKEPLTGADSGLAVVKVLELAEKSLASGREIYASEKR